MKTVIYTILSIVLSELFFLLGYILAGILVTTLYVMLDQIYFSVRKLRLADTVNAAIVGILCASLATFGAICVAHSFSGLTELPILWIVIVCLFFPLIGLLSNIKRLFRKIATGYIQPSSIFGRLHHAAMNVLQEGHFSHAKFLLEHTYPEQVGLANDPLGHIAYNHSDRKSLFVGGRWEAGRSGESA
jgi:hypothetical protein